MQDIEQAGAPHNFLNSTYNCFSIETAHCYIYGIGLWMFTNMSTTSNSTEMYHIYIDTKKEFIQPTGI